MFLWPAGFFTVVHFPDEDVTVLWDRKTTVHIQVGPRWQVGGSSGTTSQMSPSILTHTIYSGSAHLPVLGDFYWIASKMSRA